MTHEMGRGFSTRTAAEAACMSSCNCSGVYDWSCKNQESEQGDDSQLPPSSRTTTTTTTTTTTRRRGEAH